jgi:hypothetical protein
MTLTGLTSDYLSDGRPISQIISHAATPPAIAANEKSYNALSSAYKQLNAPFGAFAQDALGVSTKGVTDSDSEYQEWDAQLTACQNLRQPLATDIDQLLNGASFAGSYDTGTAQSDLTQAKALLSQMKRLSSSSTPPSKTVCSG